MKILIVGSRDWQDTYIIFWRIRKLLEDYGDDITIISGGARGADRIAAFWCKTLEINLIEVHANWKKYGRAAGPIRNKLMLDMNPDLVIAFHEDLENSKGTKNTVDEAEKRGFKVEKIK
jgi:hypothetical protein